MPAVYNIWLKFMTLKTKSVSDVQIRAWHKAPPASAKACGDGLYFRARTGSSTSEWLFRYQLNKRPRWFSLGRYPDKTLAQARKGARRARVDVNDGIDVAVERRLERQAALAERTIEALANDWYGHQVEPRIEHPEVVRRRLDNHIIPMLGRIYLDEIRPIDIDRLLRKLRTQMPATSSNCLRDLRKMFKFAGKREWMETNPAANFELADAGGKPKSRDRFLESDELTVLFQAMRASKKFGRVNELSVLLLLALCIRKMELLAARWEEFDLGAGIWEMPEKTSQKGSEMKKKAIKIPLAPLVISWLHELKVFAAGSDCVFPARRITKQRRYPHVSPDTLNLALKKNIEIELASFTVHDFRRTARTHLTRLGVSPHEAERALNHKIKGVAGVYDVDDYFPQRKAALERWAKRLQELGAS